MTKAYQGPDAARRCAREAGVLQQLAGPAAAAGVPVPGLLGRDDGRLQMAFLPGVHGQELVEAGQAGAVLHACGRMLARIHAIDPATAGLDRLPGPDLSGVNAPASRPGSPSPSPHSPGSDRQGQVLVHGDYGPNNVLLDPQASAVTAVLDWEWAHRGDRVEDLAWCEWIIRMHHPAETAALSELWAGYGWAPPWAQRQQAMAAQCRALVQFCERWEPGGSGVAQWQHRLAITQSWTEQPS